MDKREQGIFSCEVKLDYRGNKKGTKVLDF